MRRYAIVVDDQPANLALLDELLTPFDLEVRMAPDGESAIALADALRPDIMLLDLVMPRVSGLEVLSRLRARSGERFPIVVVTAHTDRNLRLLALEAGADEFLEKPIDAAVLHARVRTLLELHESRLALAARNAALEAAQREQRELTQFLVHDLRNQLMTATASLGSSIGAADRAEPVPAEAVSDALSALERMARLTGDLLVVSRLEEATMPLDRQTVSVEAVLGRIARRYASRASAADVRIGVRAAPLAISADPELLERVLENLVENSLRHTPSSGEIALLGEAQADGLARLVVANSGAPIAAEDREIVFEKYGRGRGRASKPGSLGLGLYFCRRAIEAQCGRIWIDETSCWPTAFVIELPVAARE